MCDTTRLYSDIGRKRHLGAGSRRQLYWVLINFGNKNQDFVGSQVECQRIVAAGRDVGVEDRVLDVPAVLRMNLRNVRGLDRNSVQPLAGQNIDSVGPNPFDTGISIEKRVVVPSVESSLTDIEIELIPSRKPRRVASDDNGCILFVRLDRDFQDARARRRFNSSLTSGKHRQETNDSHTSIQKPFVHAESLDLLDNAELPRGRLPPRPRESVSVSAATTSFVS